MHNRRSIRLRHYDYQKDGILFVTICTYHKRAIFGRVINGRMQLNEIGKIARDEWIKTAQLRDYVKIDAFVIMPDHMHGLLVISRGDDYDFSTNLSRRGMMHHAPTAKSTTYFEYNFETPSNRDGLIPRQFSKPVKQSLWTIVGTYKAAVTRKINRLRNTPGGIIWQRNFYETIIRNEKHLFLVRQYIINNPKDHGGHKDHRG
jgi:REP element-mobilizing transposase RayT